MRPGLIVAGSRDGVAIPCQSQRRERALRTPDVESSIRSIRASLLALFGLSSPI
jgi:hypothetical protein